MSRWKLTLTRSWWSSGSLSPSTWMSSLFLNKGCKDQRGVLHVRGFLSVQYEVGGGRKGEEGRKLRTHKSELTCLIVVDGFPLLCLLSPVITNRRGTWDVSWNLPSSSAVSCAAPCHPAPHYPASQQVLALSSHCWHVMTSSLRGGSIPPSPSGLAAFQLNYVARQRCIGIWGQWL